MKKLIFRDTEEFYIELKGALEAKEKIEVVTDIKRYSDLPQKIKDIFDLEKHRNNEWVNVATCAFIPMSIVPAGLNNGPLYVFAAAAVGGGAGIFLGGPFGAAVGAGIGALIGLATMAVASGKHRVRVKVDMTGCLSFEIDPVPAA